MGNGERSSAACPAKRLTFGSLFSGCGGFDLGFISRGHECRFAFDIDEIALENYRANVDRNVRRLDLRSELPHNLPVSDVVVSGPPCQGFSLAGRRNHDDPRNHLLVLAARHSVSLNPKIVAIENVRGVLSGSHREYWDAAVGIVREAGYCVRTYEMDASRFGVPQRRKRVVLFGSRVGYPPDLVEAESCSTAEALRGVDECSNHDPQVLSAQSEHGRIAARIGQGQKLCNVRRGPASVHTWSIPEVFGSVDPSEVRLLEELVLLRRRLRVRDFGDADPVPLRALSDLANDQMIARLVEAGYLRRFTDAVDLTHTFNGKYRRLAEDELAPTVDTRYGDFRYFLHPTEDRGLTVREAARIQGFPDEYVFSGPTSTQFRLVGNAVPPPMAAAIACACEQLLLEGA